jgi:tRNA (guanosine-2'-O-)-methyltransferase
MGRPITERRLARMREVLARRQPDLTVVLENVHDPHNVSAVLRSCDAVGLLRVHLVYTIEEFPELSENVSGSALKWLELVFHPSIEACYRTLRSQGFTIYTTYLGDPARSVDLYDLDLTKPVALVFGNEQRGVSDEAVAGADGNFVIPMMGMVRSLNISVACAVSCTRRCASVAWPATTRGRSFRPPNWRSDCSAGSSARDERCLSNCGRAIRQPRASDRPAAKAAMTRIGFLCYTHHSRVLVGSLMDR